MANNQAPGWSGKNLEVRDFLDCLDTDKMWTVAEVVAATPSTVTVHFVDWSHQWDEIIPRDSARLAPFQAHTRGPTGPNTRNQPGGPTAPGGKPPGTGAPGTGGVPPGGTGAVQPANMPPGTGNNGNSNAANPPANANANTPANAETEELKKFRLNLKVGDLCDFFNEYNRWQLAEVTKARSIEVAVRVHGEDRDSPWISRSSNRIHPAFTKSEQVGASAPPPGPDANRTAGSGAPGGSPNRTPANANANNLAMPGNQPLTANQLAAHTPGTLSQLPGGEAVPQPCHATFYAGLKKGDNADVLDQEDKWRFSEILQVKDDQLLVHYVDWSNKWDQWLPRNTPRIQLPRTKTEGYTGPPEKDPRRLAGGLPVYDPYRVDYTSTYTPTYSSYTPSYDCLSNCRWKRVMMQGLSPKDVEALDKLFAKGCKLQDDIQDLLLGRRQAGDMKTKIAEFNKEITEAQGNLAKNCAFYLQQCQSIADNAGSSIKESEATTRRQQLAGNEADFFKNLTKDFHVVEIPSDGNCLFAATGRGQSLRQKLIEAETPEAVSKIVSEARNVTKDDSLNIGRMLRLALVGFLREQKKFHQQMRAEVQDALQQAPGSEGSNQTTRLITAQMKDKFKDNPLSGVETEFALDTYVGVMGQDGIYGTMMEVNALSEHLQVPLHLYFRESGSEQPAGPTRTVGAEFKAPAISLAFYMGNKHYNLLIPRQPLNPKPQPKVEEKPPQTAESKDGKEGKDESKPIQTQTAVPSNPAAAAASEGKHDNSASASASAGSSPTKPAEPRQENKGEHLQGQGNQGASSSVTRAAVTDNSHNAASAGQNPAANPQSQPAQAQQGASLLAAAALGSEANKPVVAATANTGSASAAPQNS